MCTTLANIHSLIPRSVANGPGARAVVWFQGCTLGCVGCFNPDTHPHDASNKQPVSHLINYLCELDDIEGVTISGGEPFQQPNALLTLVQHLRLRTRLSIIIFTGYELNELSGIENSPGILHATDVLITGRFQKTERLARGLRGSSNKRVHFLSDRYADSDFDNIPESEVLITERGELVVTGIDPLLSKEIVR